MPLKITCPNCGTLHRNIGKAHLGQLYRCTCGKVVRIGSRSGSISSRPVPQPVQRESRPAPTPVARPDQRILVAPTRVVQASQRPFPFDNAEKTTGPVFPVAEAIVEEDIVDDEEVFVVTEADVVPIPSRQMPPQDLSVVVPTRIIKPAKQPS